MIGGTSFYNSLFKKYVVIFGTLFNNINIERVGADGVTVEQTILVPIAYGPREKFLARIVDNPDAIAQTSIKLPRIAFSLAGITYASDRKLTSLNKIASKNNLNGVNVYKKVYNPVPYDLNFKMEILSKTMEDGLRIIEQILPYFTPEWTISAALLSPDFDNITDIPLILNTVEIEDDYDDTFVNRKVLTFTLNFTMKAYFYGPITESRIIKFTTVNIYPDTTANTNITTTIIRPGLTVGGEPTSNLELSVALSQINELDNYGFIVTTTDKNNG